MSINENGATMIDFLIFILNVESTKKKKRRNT